MKNLGKLGFHLPPQHLPPWRNRLARSAVNRKVGGSSPPGGEEHLLFQPLETCWTWKLVRGFPSPSKAKYCKEPDRAKDLVDLGRIRTCNLLIRSQTRYPLRHEAAHVGHLMENQLPAPPTSFRSVVVITCASHAQGRRFEPGRKQPGTLFASLRGELFSTPPPRDLDARRDGFKAPRVPPMAGSLV